MKEFLETVVCKPEGNDVLFIVVEVGVLCCSDLRVCLCFEKARLVRQASREGKNAYKFSTVSDPWHPNRLGEQEEKCQPCCHRSLLV